MNIGKKIKRFKELINSTYSFAKSGVWQIRSSELKGFRAFRIQFLRVIVLTVRGYYSDKLSLRASALTFFSMLSIVPVIAMAFGIAKGFGLEKALEREIHQALPGQEVITEQVMVFARSMLQDTQGGTIAGVGLIILLWTVIRLLDNIETSFNDIWEVSKHRSLERKFTDYMTIMIFAPFLIILASSANIFITTQIKSVTENIELLKVFSPLILFALQVLPYTLIWLLMTLLYLIMPNTKIYITPAFIAGIIAGTFYQFWQWIYISSQVGVSRYNAIYGSFAALPLFLIWLQLSWFIVLLGAELSFAIQNVNKYEFKDVESKISFSFRRLLAVVVAHLVVKRFEKGENPYSIKQMSDEMQIPVRLVRQTVLTLVECNIISEINSADGKDELYQPAKAIQRISIGSVTEAIEKLGMRPELEMSDNLAFKVIKKRLDDMNKNIHKMECNTLLKDI